MRGDRSERQVVVALETDETEATVLGEEVLKKSKGAKCSVRKMERDVSWVVVTLE